MKETDKEKAIREIMLEMKVIKIGKSTRKLL